MSYDKSLLELAGFSPEEIEEMFAKHEEKPNSTNDKSKIIKDSKVQNSNKNSKSNIKINSIHKGHRQRVRDKFIKHGFGTFTEYEVLEYMLFYAIPYKDTNEIAHRLIDRFGSLKGVIDADFHDLVDVNGISDVAASLIIMYHELHKYIRSKVNTGVSLHRAHLAADYCCKYFYDHLQECLIMISMDANRIVKCIDVISEGTETETAYYPRKIVQLAMRNRANTVIIAHNHPGDNPEPSTNDINITKKITKMLDDVNIDLVDHIICSGDKYTCFSEKEFL